MIWSEQAFRDEMDHHIEASTLDGIRRGLDEPSARSQARARLGDIRTIRRRCRRVALAPRRVLLALCATFAGGALIATIALASARRELEEVRARLATAVVDSADNTPTAIREALTEARAANRRGQWRQAITLATHALRRPESTVYERCEALISMAHAHRCLTQPREARAALRAARAQGPASRRPDLARRIARLSDTLGSR